MIHLQENIRWKKFKIEIKNIEIEYNEKQEDLI